MRTKFGLTVADYNQLYRDAECWVCGATESVVAGKPARLVVDHDHQTGKIRGILCHYCNMAVGLGEDNPAMLRRMADYLEDYEANGGPLD